VVALPHTHSGSGAARLLWSGNLRGTDLPAAPEEFAVIGPILLAACLRAEAPFVALTVVLTRILPACVFWITRNTRSFLPLARWTTRLFQALLRDFPETQIRLIVGVEQLGACRKTNNLCRLAKEARNELLVMNDSDVRVEKDYLRAVTAPFRDAKVGVVTAFFRGITGSGLA
jgi:cellulose synthase/poly-beta-1,6-N-acetylglucosamine synthase-like glycosyltransferase